MKLLKC